MTQNGQKFGLGVLRLPLVGEHVRLEDHGKKNSLPPKIEMHLNLRSWNPGQLGSLQRLKGTYDEGHKRALQVPLET